MSNREYVASVQKASPHVLYRTGPSPSSCYCMCRLIWASLKMAMVQSKHGVSSVTALTGQRLATFSTHWDLPHQFLQPHRSGRADTPHFCCLRLAPHSGVRSSTEYVGYT